MYQQQKDITKYRKRLLISACFFRAYTSRVCGVHALKNHQLINKRLRYLNSFQNGKFYLIFKKTNKKTQNHFTRF